MNSKQIWFYDNKDILNNCFKIMLNYISTNISINLVVDIKKFYNDFLNMIYDEYVKNIKPTNNYTLSEFNLEYFELKHSSDIVDIFIKYKIICKNNCSNLFHNKYNNADNLINFISKNIEINSINYESDNDSDNDSSNDFNNNNCW